MNDDAKKKILARRSAFIAAALAGVAGATSCASPQPCLEPPPSGGAGVSPDGGANVESQDRPKDPPPQPCLAPPPAVSYPEPPLLDAGLPPADAAGWPIPPQPCLSIKYVPPDAGAKPPQPTPHPCLTPRRP